jgi:hypothetical protein
LTDPEQQGQQIRKGQIQWLQKREILGQVAFTACHFNFATLPLSL